MLYGSWLVNLFTYFRFIFAFMYKKGHFNCTTPSNGGKSAILDRKLITQWDIQSKGKSSRGLFRPSMADFVPCDWVAQRAHAL